MSTEDDILQSMGIESDEQEATTPDFGLEEQTPAQPAQPEPVASDVRAADTPREQPKEETPQASAPQQQQERLKSDAKGNLINERGQVVAAAGAHRRHFERMQNALGVVDRQSAYIRDLEAQVREAKSTSGTALNGLPQQLGLNDQEAAMGLRLIQSYKRDPVGTIKYILTEAAASGHNVNDLIGRDGGIDIGAIGRMIDQRLQPVTDRYSQEQAQLQARQEAERQINQFYARYPDAPVHEDVIGRMLQMDPNMTLEGAYAQLMRVAQHHGLDFSQPLRPQLEAKQSAPQPSAVQPSRSMPSGRAPNPNPTAVSTTPVDANLSYQDIIRSSMAAAGINDH